MSQLTKYILLLGLVASSLQLSAQKIVGEWKVLQSGDKINPVDDKATITKDGDFILESDVLNWKKTDDPNILAISKDGDDPRNVKIEYLSNNQVKLTPVERPDDVLILERISSKVAKIKEGKQISAKKMRKVIVGKWKTNSPFIIAGFHFKKDGNVEASKGEDNDKKGTWTIADDGTSLIIIDQTGSPGADAKVLYINKNTLEFIVDGGRKIILKRTKE
ncbi:MAG: hypothetical protein MK212_07880 [Saprospiraceae bacterium]|nr:hypothetical protein [Saprospiraceae bacterium]